jgi:dolichol kinase
MTAHDACSRISTFHRELAAGKAPLENRQNMRSSGENPLKTEISRQVVHMLVALFAILLRWLSYPQALACAVAAIVFNVFILPRLPGGKQRLYRADERERGFSMGILAYPVSVFLLILLFPIPVAAAMWGVLSFGDGPATLVGSLATGGSLPWNSKKTVSGFVAFVLGALPSAAFLFWWTLPNIGSSPPWWRAAASQAKFSSLGSGEILILSFVVAIVCAFLESLETKIDDNLLAPLGGAILMTGLIYVFF